MNRRIRSVRPFPPGGKWFFGGVAVRYFGPPFKRTGQPIRFRGGVWLNDTPVTAVKHACHASMWCAHRSLSSALNHALAGYWIERRFLAPFRASTVRRMIEEI